MVRDALGLVAALGYKTVAGVIGHDFGSPIAAWCALLRPDIFRAVALMSAPFAGPPALAPAAPTTDIHTDLAALDRPRKHYQWYYSTRPANVDMLHCPQGVHDFLRAYYHHKSADWKANKPFRLAGWTAAVLAVLPAATLAYKGGLHENAKIPDTGQARIILWNFTAHKFLERPLLGVGAFATHAIDDALKPTAQILPGENYAQRTGQHSHNIFLQTWFELGAIGALLLLGSGVLLWRSIAGLPDVAQPFVLATFASAMCIGAFTWGLWQEWYQSLFALSALLAGLGGIAVDQRETTVMPGEAVPVTS